MLALLYGYGGFGEGTVAAAVRDDGVASLTLEDTAYDLDKLL